MTSGKDRSILFVDKQLQGALALRVTCYGLFCVLGVFSLLALFPVLMTLSLSPENAPPPGTVILETWSTYWPALMALLLLLPAVLWDVVRFSNRFVGPMHRLRSAMRDLADGKPVKEIQFREDDFWREFADEFNRLAQATSGQDSDSQQTAQSDQEDVEEEELLETAS